MPRWAGRKPSHWHVRLCRRKRAGRVTGRVCARKVRGVPARLFQAVGWLGGVRGVPCRQQAARRGGRHVHGLHGRDLPAR